MVPLCLVTRCYIGCRESPRPVRPNLCPAAERYFLVSCHVIRILPDWLTEAVAVRSPKFRVLDHADTSKSPFLPSLQPQLPWKTPPLFLPESSLSCVPWFRLIAFSTSRLLRMFARSAYPSLVKNWCWLYSRLYTPLHPLESSFPPLCIFPCPSIQFWGLPELCLFLWHSSHLG